MAQVWAVVCWELLVWHVGNNLLDVIAHQASSLLSMEANPVWSPLWDDISGQLEERGTTCHLYITSPLISWIKHSLPFCRLQYSETNYHWLSVLFQIQILGIFNPSVLKYLKYRQNIYLSTGPVTGAWPHPEEGHSEVFYKTLNYENKGFSNTQPMYNLSCLLYAVYCKMVLYPCYTSGTVLCWWTILSQDHTVLMNYSLRRQYSVSEPCC